MVNKKKDALSQFRKQIDVIDNQLAKLITERASLAQQIALVKRQKSDSVSFYRPEREAQVLKKIKKNHDGVLPQHSMVHIFREIMSACLALEQSLKVAFLGPEGTFTQEAALKHFGSAVNSVDCATIEDVFVSVAKGNSDYGVVPIENSTNGIIGATVDMLYNVDLRVCGEVEIAIHHQLMSLNCKQKIETIFGHQQAFDQCRRWLENHYPNVIFKAVTSNALAARLAKETKNSAAIGSEYALSVYGLERIAKNIEDNISNSTRFLVIGHEEISPSQDDKTSILVLTKHKSGALFDVLEPFKNLDINIYQLARHPLANVKWEYLFFLDFAGHCLDDKVQKALKTVEQRAKNIKVLGSYPISAL